jgi:hypothetical protein
MSKLKVFMLSLLMMLGGIGGALVLVEIIVRLTLSGGNQVAWNDRPKFYFKHERAKTLQDYHYSSEKGENVYRIAVVGDSYSFAPFMQFTDSFPKKLEQMLNLNDTTLKAEILNYGVPAYSTMHEVAAAEKALDDNADFMILQITLNDPELKPYRPTGINLSLGDRFGQPQYSETQRKLFKYWRTLEFVYRRLHNTRTHNEYKNYFLELYENPRSWNTFKESLKQIVDSCRARNVKIVAVVFPLFGLAMDENYPFYGIHDKVSKELEALGVDHLDVSSIYNGIPLERLQVMPGVDRHPNEIAHRMAAEAIYEFLIGRNLLPPELVIRQRFKGRTQIIKEEPYYANAS